MHGIKIRMVTISFFAGYVAIDDDIRYNDVVFVGEAIFCHFIIILGILIVTTYKLRRKKLVKILRSQTAMIKFAEKYEDHPGRMLAKMKNNHSNRVTGPSCDHAANKLLIFITLCFVLQLVDGFSQLIWYWDQGGEIPMYICIFIAFSYFCLFGTKCVPVVMLLVSFQCTQTLLSIAHEQIQEFLARRHHQRRNENASNTESITEETVSSWVKQIGTEVNQIQKNHEEMIRFLEIPLFSIHTVSMFSSINNLAYSIGYEARNDSSVSSFKIFYLVSLIVANLGSVVVWILQAYMADLTVTKVNILVLH